MGGVAICGCNIRASVRPLTELGAVQLVKHFASEQKALGYPPATLFAFCISLVAYNVLAVVQASLRSAHGEAASPENLSSYYGAHNLDISKYRKHKRGPKKPPTPRTRFRNTPHVSTKRLLEEAKQTTKS